MTVLIFISWSNVKKCFINYFHFNFKNSNISKIMVVPVNRYLNYFSYEIRTFCKSIKFINHLPIHYYYHFIFSTGYESMFIFFLCNLYKIIFVSIWDSKPFVLIYLYSAAIFIIINLINLIFNYFYQNHRKLLKILNKAYHP